MKITYLLTWPYEMGGTERTIITQAEAMAHRHDVEIVGVMASRAAPFFPIPSSVPHRILIRTDTDGIPTEAAGVDAPTERLSDLHAAPSRLVPAAWESAFSQLSDLALNRWFAGLQCDVLVTTTPPLLALASQLAPEPVVVVHQEHRTSERRGSSLPPLVSHGPRVDAVAFLTSATVEHFSEAWGSASPVILRMLNPLPPELRPVSNHDRPLIVAAGRLTSEKRFDHLIDAFAPVAEMHPEWTLRIFGEGPQESSLRRQITRLQLTDRVELMGPSSTMGAEWASASIAALSSRSEGLGLVIQEAMAAGTPVVSYACPNGPAELISDGVNGILVENGNVGELTAALMHLVTDPERRRLLGEAARLRARSFDAAAIAEQWEQHFAALLRDVRAAETRLERVIRRTHAHGGHLSRPRDRADAARSDTPLSAIDPSPAVGSMVGGSPSLANARAGVVLVSGRETVVNTGLLPGDARRENLRIVVEAAAVAGAPAFRLPAATPPRVVVVPDRNRGSLAEALSRAAAAGGLYIAPIAANGRVGRAVLADDADDLWRIEPARVRVFRRWGNPERTMFYGADLGCDLAFWREEGDLLVGTPGGIVAEVPTAWLEHRITSLIDNVPVPELARLAGLTLMDEITFPVDAVYTWVDGSDPGWLADRRRRRMEAHGPLHLEADSEARYRSRDELRFSLRSLDYHAPWIRRVFLVTAGQAPDWLRDEHPDVTLVSHRDIFTRQDDLPTFNSHAIESQLHHIDGLAEQFIYINDDVFFGRSVSPSQFFAPGGMPAVFTSPTLVGFPDGEVPPHMRAALNNRRLLQQDFGRTLTNAMLHTAHPLRRSILDEMEERYPKGFAMTSGSPFRNESDLSVTSSLFQHYALLTGRAVRGALRVSYVGLGGRDVGRRLTRLLNERKFDVFSIGDFHESDLPPGEIDDMVRSFVQAYWPFPSRFEA